MITPIANKFRSDARKGRGLTLTQTQLQELMNCGVYDLIAQIEAEELRSGWQDGTSSETTRLYRRGTLPYETSALSVLAHRGL